MKAPRDCVAGEGGKADIPVCQENGRLFLRAYPHGGDGRLMQVRVLIGIPTGVPCGTLMVPAEKARQFVDLLNSVEELQMGLVETLPLIAVMATDSQVVGVEKTARLVRKLGRLLAKSGREPVD